MKYPASDNIYNEIFNYLSSIEIYKDDIIKQKTKYPNMNINQIYSSFPLIYPYRLKGNTVNISKRRKTFRDLCANFQLNKQKIFVIKNPYKESLDANEEKWYKIPYSKEKEIIINNYHWNYNHCGRDAVILYIKRAGWYWYEFFKDIELIIKDCPQCDNAHNKFKKI